MKRIFYLIVLLFFLKMNAGLAQCPAGNVTLTTNSEITAFGSAFIMNGCKNLNGHLLIDGSNTGGFSINTLYPLRTIESIKGNLIIRGTENLQNLDGMYALKSIGGFLDIRNTKNFVRPYGLEQLNSVGGIWLENNPQLYTLGGIQNITELTGGEEAYVTLRNNLLLQDISGIANLPHEAISYLEINGNGSLQVCDYPHICAYLAGSGARYIEGNAGACMNEAAVAAECLPEGAVSLTLSGMNYAALNGVYTARASSSGRLAADKYTFVKATPGFSTLFCTMNEVKIYWNGSKWILAGDCVGAFGGNNLFGEAEGDPDKAVPPCGEAFGGTVSSNSEGCYTLTCTPPVPDVQIASVNACAGGSASLSATCSGDAEVRWYTSGGTFISSGPAFTATDISNSTTYSVRCHNGTCEGEAATVSVNVSPAPTLALVSVTPPSCAGGGSILFSTTGLTGIHTVKYTFNGISESVSVKVTANSLVVTNLSAGKYTDFYIAGNTCGNAVFADEIIMTAAEGNPTLLVSSSSDPSDCGESDGKIVFSTTHVSDGSEIDFEYSVNGGPMKYIRVTVNNNAFTLSGLYAATYSDFTLHHMGCSASDQSEKSLAGPAPKYIVFDESKNPSACGSSDGSMSFHTDLPDGNYTLRWQHQHHGAQSREVSVQEGHFTLSGLDQGKYSRFTVMYKKCETLYKEESRLLECPVSFSFELASKKRASCMTFGRAYLVFSTRNLGDTEDYYYKLEAYHEGAFEQFDVEPDADGKFEIEVQPDVIFTRFILYQYSDDDAGFWVYTPDEPVLAGEDQVSIQPGTLTPPSAPWASDGSISFVSNLFDDCCLNLSFSWSGSQETQYRSVEVTAGKFTVSGLASGTYSDFYFPSDACGSHYYTEPLVLSGQLPVLAAGSVTHPATCGGNDGSISFTTNAPEGDYELGYKKGGNSQTIQVTVAGGAFVLKGLSRGEYSAFSITKGNGAVRDESIKILSDPGAPVLSSEELTHPAVCGGTGSIAFTSDLADDIYTLNYLKGELLESAEIKVKEGKFILVGLSQGSYSAFSVNIKGCTGTDPSVKVLNDPSFNFSVKEKTGPVTCGGSEGRIIFSTDLSDGIYRLNYRQGGDKAADVQVSSGIFMLENLSGGVYDGFRINLQGCEYLLDEPVNVASPVIPGSNITPSGSTELCEGSQVTLTAAEGASYLWSTGATTRTLVTGAAGTYKVMVTTSQGCASEAEITITQKVCNLPPVAVCKPLVVLVANDDCYALLTTKDLDNGSHDPNGDWTRHSLVNTDGIFRPGEYTVTYEVMDPTGAFSTCESKVRVLDHTPPVARARSLTLELGPTGQVSIRIDDVNDGSYDNCGPVTMSLNRTTFNCADLGHLQVRLTVTDASGNVSEALSDITIVDNTPPVIQATGLKLPLDESGRAVITSDKLITGITDNCGIWSISLSQSEFSCEHIGENQVTITVEDVRGNRSTASVIVTVADTTPPAVAVKDLTVYLDKDGRASLTAAMADEGSSDNCGIARLELGRSDFGCNDLGEHTLTLKATDAAGNLTEASFALTVRDTLAPLVTAADITLYLDKAGRAVLKPEDIDQGSSDNCGIAERRLQYSAFDCSHTGAQPVQYTVTDASGNYTTVVIQVTVKDTIAPEVFTRNAVLELNTTGKATLTPDEVDDASSDNCGIAERTLSQTEFSCSDLGRRMISFTVRDVNGNISTDRLVAEITDPNGVCPCSYGVLAFEGISLKNNQVSAGGVGVIHSGKKVRLRNTVIDQQGTFVKAPQSRFDNRSQASTYIRGNAPEPEAFRNNPNKDKKKSKAGKGESLSLSAGRYGKIKAAKGATLTFTGGEVYIRSLKVKREVSLLFLAPTYLLVRNEVRLGENSALNLAGEQVRIYAGDRITIGNASEVRGYFHSRGRLKTRSGGETTSLEGLFVANKIKGGRNTFWAGGGVLCTGNEQPEQTVAARRKRRKTGAAGELLLPESTDSSIRVRLWPNPVVSDILKISLESDTPGGELQLLDFHGNSISRKTYSGHQAYHEVNMRNTMPGTYILRVSSGGEVRTLRVLKEKR